MNARSNTIAPAAPATSELGDGPEIFSTAVNASALAGLDLQHLSDLYDACRTMMNVVAGLGCQPRFQEAFNRSRYNAAGAQLDLFHELAAACLTAVVDEAEARKPSDREQALTRAWLLARDGAILCDDFAEFRAMIEREAGSVTDDAAIVDAPAEAPAAGIEMMFAEWRQLHERDITGETEAENEAAYARYVDLQELIVRAEPTTPHDLAMMAFADNGGSVSDFSQEFGERLVAMALTGRS